MFFDRMPRLAPENVRRNGPRRSRPAARPAGAFARPRLAIQLAVAASLAPGLAGCIGYDGEGSHGYQLDPRSLDQIKVGSSAEQVLVVMGYPSTTSTVGGDSWYYVTQVTDR